MALSDEALWIFRFLMVIIITVYLVVIFTIVTPTLEATELRADIFSARIANNPGFYESPGVIDLSKFTQATADSMYVYNEENFIPVGAKLTLLDTNFQPDQSVTTLVYNPNSLLKLEPLFGARIKGVHKELTVLPVHVKQGTTTTEAYLQMEVYYEI